ncbi:glycosyltransferase [Vibrio sp. 10N.247.311.18]|uniref:glycosyltransferase n=1 Tax=unclassified Vibrio TaxID=2614977 RepID=UPI00354D9C32
MKVLHVYRTCYPETSGGVEQVIRSITEGCIAHGVESKVLTLADESKDDYKQNNVTIVTVKKSFQVASNGFSFQLISRFRELAKWADVIHFHYPWPTGDLLGFFLNKPSIVTYHSDIIRQKFLKVLYRPLELNFLDKVDKLIATSPQYATSSNNLSRFKNKVEVIPLGIDESHYKQPSNSILRKWKEKVGEQFFLFIGVLRYYKGLDHLLEAASLSKLPIVIAGKGPMEKQLHAKAKSLGLKNVVFVGFISEDDKVALLTLCKAFVFSSHLRSEAFGVSLLEAQLFGKPLISCEVGTGSSYVNQHQKTGLIVEPANPLALANALKEMNENPKLAEQYGQKSYERFKRLFTNKQQCEQYFQIYRGLGEKNSN